MIVFDEFPDIKIEINDLNSPRESIKKAIGDAIYSGHLPPGSRIVESILAKKLKISRTPVREAMLQLQSEGAVKIIPNKGAIVNTFSIDEIKQIYAIFGALEGVAAELGMEFITENELEQMDTCLVNMEEGKLKKDKREFFTQNDIFHSIFLKACKKRLLLKLIKSYTKQVGRYWYLFLSNPSSMELFSEEHRGILEAFRLRNPKMAKERVENHIKSVSQIIIESLESISGRGLNYPLI